MNKFVYILVAVIIVIVGAWFFTQNKDSVGVAELRQHIVGTWQSLDDGKSVEVYIDNGTSRSLYDGQELANGTWEIYTKDGANGGPSDNFIRKIDSTNVAGDGVFEYAILEADGDTLMLTYLGRGNILRYKRIADEQFGTEL